IPIDAADPAERLRRAAAAVRVHFTWWGVHRTLTARQKEEVCGAAGADARLLSAGKKIVDVRHPAVRGLTAAYWRGLTLPYVDPGVRLIRQADVEPFAAAMADFRADLAAAESAVDAAYDGLKADARARLGRLYDPGDY